jgi:lipid II isoglutaminyl synthase (glutamine-hydrolysing)
VALALAPDLLHRLARGRRVVLVSGTNGKTTTAHMLAAALRTAGPVAHNATGANMVDGAAAALMAVDAPCAVLEVDELHVGRVADAVRPEALVLLNLTRDQLDRGSEVHAVADSIAAALSRRPEMLVLANADDPVVVGVARVAARVVWVAGGAGWLADAGSCPGCTAPLVVGADGWRCRCGFARPSPAWAAHDGVVRGPDGEVALQLALPGRFNWGNAAFAIAAAGVLGVPPGPAAKAIGALRSVAGRYTVVRRGDHEIHLLLAKNPAGWAEILPLLPEADAVLLVVNAREADGRDTSWLWDVPFERLTPRPLVAGGARAADLGLRLSYADLEHRTCPDPLAALDLLPPGSVYVVANYTAFSRLLTRLGTAEER